MLSGGKEVGEFEYGYYRNYYTRGRHAAGDGHAGQERQDPCDRGRSVRLLPGDASGRRRGAGGSAGLLHRWRRCGPPPDRRRIRRGRVCRCRSRPVLADGAGAARLWRQTGSRALAAAARKDHDQRARHGGYARVPAHATAVQRPRGDDGLLLRRAAILGPKRLGYDAGISCHGSQMLDYIGELDGVTAPVCISWGDQDHRAPRRCWTPIVLWLRA